MNLLAEATYEIVTFDRVALGSLTTAVTAMALYIKSKLDKCEVDREDLWREIRELKGVELDED